ncbi:MAG: DUF2807 domain-containing protein [Bacteroidetes bacterium]|nr:DUF2807 domain-containing protein [Bacteroidota bacterium]
MDSHRLQKSEYSPPLPPLKSKTIRMLYSRTGSPQEVRVEAKTPLNGIQTTVEGNTLTIQGPPSTIYITLAELSGINISGIGKVSGDSMIFANHLRISISGNGKVALPIDVNKLEVGISGIGRLELSGRADQLDINISGSGSWKALHYVKKLQCQYQWSWEMLC